MGKILMMHDDIKETFLKLVKQFRCQVCNKNLRPPIRMCKDGHNFCDVCKKESECVVCGVIIMQEHRNVELENMEAV